MQSLINTDTDTDIVKIQIEESLAEHEDRKEIISKLQLAVKNFTKEIMHISMGGFLEHESYELKKAVHIAGGWCIDFHSELQSVSNYVDEKHREELNYLHKNAIEQDTGTLLEPLSAEDVVALFKSHVTEELAASRECRQLDASREKAFEEKLNKLQKSYFEYTGKK